MAEFEIPFTRSDFGLMLHGETVPKTVGLLKQALAARLPWVEEVTKREATRMDLQRILQHKDSKCFFRVPTFFWTAWGMAHPNDHERRVFGMKICPWDREFIVAELDANELSVRLAEAGVPEVGRELY